MAEQNPDPGFAMAELRGWSLTQLEFRPGHSARIEELLRGTWSLMLPARVGDVLGVVPVQAMRVALDRIWILMESDGQSAEAINAWPGSLSLTHGRRRYRLSGAHCTEVLAKGIALDLEGSGFPTGRTAQTQVHRMPVLLHRRQAQNFDIFVPHSFSESFEAWIADTAMETGWKPPVAF
jgi:heterotetrameric sarcosine oxidase gamma subunit